MQIKSHQKRIREIEALIEREMGKRNNSTAAARRSYRHDNDSAIDILQSQLAEELHKIRRIKSQPCVVLKKNPRKRIRVKKRFHKLRGSDSYGDCSTETGCSPLSSSSPSSSTSLLLTQFQFGSDSSSGGSDPRRSPSMAVPTSPSSLTTTSPGTTLATVWTNSTAPPVSSLSGQHGQPAVAPMYTPLTAYSLSKHNQTHSGQFSSAHHHIPHPQQQYHPQQMQSLPSPPSPLLPYSTNSTGTYSNGLDGQQQYWTQHTNPQAAAWLPTYSSFSHLLFDPPQPVQARHIPTQPLCSVKPDVGPLPLSSANYNTAAQYYYYPSPHRIPDTVAQHQRPGSCVESKLCLPPISVLLHGEETLY